MKTLGAEAQMIDLRLGDCLEILPTLEAGSVDAIITDLPYGATACSWDEVIPFEPMWKQVKRLLKPRGVFVTTTSQPFTSKLVMSNTEWFRYEWVWNKKKTGNPYLAKTQPMKVHENVVVFSENSHNYYPQMWKGIFRIRKPTPIKSENYGAKISSDYASDDRYPLSIIDCTNAYQHGKQHPTQKPVALYEYLVRTYTNPGDVVMDIAMGSGTTGVACVKTDRDFIGIELKNEYFEIAEKRIAEVQLQTVMPI